MDFDNIDIAKIYIEVLYRPESNKVSVLASEEGLKHIISLLESLVDSDIPGKHFHYVAYKGLEGNVAELTVMKGERGDEVH